jgi:hypothetical protein
VLIEANNSKLTVEQERGALTHVVTFVVPRVGPRYPNILVTIRYQLVPDTGLFRYQKEQDITCIIGPDGWDSTGGFSAPDYFLQKHMMPGNRIFKFDTFVLVELHDAKVSVGAFDSGIEFTPPRKHSRIKVEGHIDTRGRGTVKCILVS